DLEHPGVAGIARELPLDAILVGCRALHDLKLGMGGQHLVVHAADPVPPRPDLAVRHREQVFAERRAEGAEYVLRRIERDAAHQMKRWAHLRHFLRLRPLLAIIHSIPERKTSEGWPCSALVAHSSVAPSCITSACAVCLRLLARRMRKAGRAGRSSS